ncbi:hypothetical protein GGE65_007807 [Skermanella aerolata]|uniref:hypothetical protein n=1 Tax=Skermanella aerolata TaxID=393310 RepID=UPI003D1F61DD
MVARKEAELAEMAAEREAEVVPMPAPKLIVPLGRGKTGKTTFTRWSAERALTAGRQTVLADADRTNATLAAFFEHVVRPPAPDANRMKSWINEILELQIERKFSMILDLGGGDLILKEHAGELGLVELCQRHGVEPVAVHFLSSDQDDLAYLRDIERSGAFSPERTVVVFNQGILAAHLSLSDAFDALLDQEVYRKAAERGARTVFMPRLSCMAEIDRRRLLFEDAVAGRTRDGRPFGLVNRQIVTMWLRAMEAAFAEVKDWLP